MEMGWDPAAVKPTAKGPQMGVKMGTPAKVNQGTLLQDTDCYLRYIIPDMESKLPLLRNIGEARDSHEKSQ